MAIAAHWQALAQIFAERMLNSVADGVVIALFGWTLLRVLGRRQNSTTRFAVWFSALAVVAALPLCGNMAGTGATTATAFTHSAIHLPGSWALDISLLWSVVACAGLARIGFGFWQLRKLRQSCGAIDPERLHPLLRNTLEDFSSDRRLAVCISADVRVPTAIGFLAPVIVFPAWALEELSPIELNAVLLHELAHLRRRDDWTNLAQRILRALLFFHPAVWWIARGLAREREMACDDFVLAATSNPRAYAQCLVSVAEKSFLRRGLALAQAAVGRAQQTAQRVARILDVNRPSAIKVWKPALGLVAAFSALCLTALPRTPRLVAFEEAGPSVSASAARMAPALTVDPAGTGARAIPAALHSQALAASRRKHVLARSAELEMRSKNQNREDRFFSTAVESAKFVQRQPASSKLVNTIVKSSGHVAGPDSVLVVMHTEQVDEYGRVWSISVWRLTVFHPVVQPVQNGIPPKST
jgi:bla regulator protein blaR1